MTDVNEGNEILMTFEHQGNRRIVNVYSLIVSSGYTYCCSKILLLIVLIDTGNRNISKFSHIWHLWLLQFISSKIARMSSQHSFIETGKEGFQIPLGNNTIYKLFVDESSSYTGWNKKPKCQRTFRTFHSILFKIFF